MPWTVTYPGFLGRVTRTFPTHAAALQWVRQVGKEADATISATSKE